MIESTATYAGTYYYHFDGLGSVVALTNSSGNTVEVYEYDVYGRVGATDASHPNRLMFTGREYDKETGLYYYRARYYNPQIGRFLQTDPIGYGDGVNWYRYCRNNPIRFFDPSGTGFLEDIWNNYVKARDEFIASWNLYAEAARVAVDEYREEHPFVDGAIDGLYMTLDGATFWMILPQDVSDRLSAKYPVASKFSNGLGSLHTVALGGAAGAVLIRAAPVIVGSAGAIVDKIKGGNLQVAYNHFDWSKVDKMFRNARGHVNTTTYQESMKWVETFEKVANNESYYIGEKMKYVGDKLVGTGTKYYSGVIDGMNVWVEVYGNVIFDAGVNGDLRNIKP
jgi:RHS repeat-associated protein